ncbi:MAG: hypothetical protein ACTSVK_00300, partial [Promethearchaeota archaeon]
MSVKEKMLILVERIFKFLNKMLERPKHLMKLTLINNQRKKKKVVWTLGLEADKISMFESINNS